MPRPAVRNRKPRNKGVTAITYGLLVGLISVVAIAAINVAGDGVATLLRSTADALDSQALAQASSNGSPLVIDASAGSISFSDGPYSSVSIDTAGIDPNSIANGTSILGVTGTADSYGSGNLSCGLPSSSGMRCTSGNVVYLLLVEFTNNASTCQSRCQTGGFNDPILDGDRTLICQYDTVGDACLVSVCNGLTGTDNGARSTLHGALCTRL